jgi:hypothetical protein
VRTVTAARPKLNILLSLLLAIGTLAALGHPASHAAGALSLAAAPGTQVCDTRGAASLCANRNQGGETYYTDVIAWRLGDPNNTFAWRHLNGMCADGHVTESPPCPFTPGGGLNTRYNHAVIAQLWDYPTSAGGGNGLCVADNGAGTGETLLDACGDVFGHGAANGTIFILAQGDIHTTYAVSRYWSDLPRGGNGTMPLFLCVQGAGVPLTEASTSGSAGICQWREV